MTFVRPHLAGIPGLHSLKCVVRLLTAHYSLSNCDKPALPTCQGDQLTRNVAYYVGSAAERACNPVTVALLDIANATHVM